MWRRIWLLGGLAAGLLLVFPAAAPAANIAPNPGFETACGGPPCFWDGFGTGTTSTNTTLPHGGGASLKFTPNASTTSGIVRSDCLAFTPGTYMLDLYFKTTSANITKIDFSVGYNAMAGCTGAGGTPNGASRTLSAGDRDGNWHELAGSVTVFSGVSARVLIFALCQGATTCGAADQISFDDVVVTAPPTAVSVASFTATRSRSGVLVRWSTGSEHRLAGFHVHRELASRRVRVSRSLIPAGGPGSYSLLDRAAPRGARYWLEVVRIDGSRAWRGPVRASR